MEITIIDDEGKKFFLTGVTDYSLTYRTITPVKSNGSVHSVPIVKSKCHTNGELREISKEVKQVAVELDRYLNANNPS